LQFIPTGIFIPDVVCCFLVVAALLRVIVGLLRGLVGLPCRTAGLQREHGDALTELVGLRPGDIWLSSGRGSAETECYRLRSTFTHMC
jgi:hypothetical protein